MINIFLISFLCVGIIIYLSTIGYQTSQFNNLIYDRIKLFNNNLSLNIIPHTLKLTNLKNLKINDLVNVELDIFGKYIYKYTT